MKRLALPLLVAFAAALSSCAARVVSFPLASPQGTVAAQSNPAGSGGGSVPVDPGQQPEDFIEPVTPETDPSAMAEGVDGPDQERTVASGDLPSVDLESTDPEINPSPAAEAPAFLSERPAGEHSGPVPILIDAPDGSTATYSLDRNDPLDAPMSFVIDDVSPGDHVLEIVVQYPNGDTTTLEHHWTQMPEQTETESKPKSRKEKRDRKPKEDKSKEDKSKEDKSKEDKSKEDKSKEDKSSSASSGKKSS